MKIRKKQKKVSVNKYARIIDFASLFTAAVFLLSVTKTAAVAAGNIATLQWGTIPMAYVLILGLLLVFLNWYNAKAKFSLIGVIALTILLTSATVWMIGLHSVWPLGQKIIPL